MFESLARFSIRFRWLIVVAWIAGVVVVNSALPSLSSIAKANNAQFLSSSSPSLRAAELATPFQGKNASMSAIIVASIPSGRLTAGDLAAIGRVEQAARGVSGVVLVHDEGKSADGRASQTLVTVSPPVANSNGASKRVVDEIRTSFTRAGAPPGFSFHLARQHSTAAAASPHGGQFISPDGLTIQYYAVLRAGPGGSANAASAIPQARTALAAVARATGASANGIAGQDASAHDINQASTDSLAIVVPVVLTLILALLALLLRSFVAPWYLALTIGLSYLASLGFAMIVFVHLGGQGGLIFVLPLLMFVFSMALGEDYNILIMSRIREESQRHESFAAALTHAIGVTGTTITSAGVILAGTFAVLGIAGGSTQAQQLGYSIAFGVLLDTLFVRSLLIPSIAMLLGPLNWWPSTPAHAAPSTSKRPAVSR